MSARLVRHVAYHEAGHAVAHLALDEGEDYRGPAIRRAVVHRNVAQEPPHDGAELGFVEVDARAFTHTACFYGDDPEYRRAARLDAVMALAGPAAEIRVRRMSMVVGALTVMGGDGSDVQSARRKLKLAGGEEPLNARLTLAWDEAMLIVRRHWPAIKALAAALLDQGELEGDNVEQIVADAMPDAFPRLRQALAVKDAA